MPSSRPLRHWAGLWLAGLLVALSLSGIAIQLASANSWVAALNYFNYYTIQSNGLVALAAGWYVYQHGRGRPASRGLLLFKSGTTLWILVTGIVFHFLLSARWHPTGWLGFANVALHYLTPLGLTLHWLLFEPKGRYEWRFALYWLSYPLLYLLFAWTRGALTGLYPYWFLNPTRPYPEGTGSLAVLLLLVGGLLLFFTVLGLLIVWLDQRLARHHPTPH